jgi:uncharacterized protein YodC (DUF2158 family)
MATKFKKGDVVQVNKVIPKGPVLALHMNSDGEFFYEIEWTDAEGVAQKRWFAEDELVAGA